MTSCDNWPEHTAEAMLEASSRHRYRQAGLTSIAAMGARATTVLTAIAVVPLALGYLGAERCGIWLTPSSFLALLGFMDLLSASALVTTVARTGGGAKQQSTARCGSIGVHGSITAVAAWGVGSVVADGFIAHAVSIGIQTVDAAKNASLAMTLFGAMPVSLALDASGRT